ncbi:MAG: ABC transporter substrate-binding protein [Proteobacteria bacterium]|nr:ABC transporter substrate-binding protein [Pseudomonadota bacterium]
MRRRAVLAGLGGAAVWPLAARAQQRHMPRVGVLVAGNPDPGPFWRLFQEALRDLGYVGGQTVRFEFRSAEGQAARLADLAADLVRLSVDIIVTWQTPTVQAAKQATKDIPIVMADSGDPVGTGLVASLARPGGNITGMAGVTAELAGKSVELIREMIPSVRRVGALCNPSDPFSKPFLEQIQLGGRAAGIEIQPVMVRADEAFDVAFSRLSGERIDAVIVQPSLPTKRAAELALNSRLPAVSVPRWFAEEGGLMSYSPRLADLYREAAVYVDKILKGAKPADLPIQQPTKFELVINLKTARALGLTIPPSILARADEVIE